MQQPLGLELPACRSAKEPPGVRRGAVSLSQAPGPGCEGHQRMPTGGCFPRGPGATPAPPARAALAAPSPCCLMVMSPTTPASPWPGRSSTPSSHGRCLLTPAARSAHHCCPPSLASWVQATWLGLGKHTCSVLLQAHFFQSSQQPYKVGHGKVRKMGLRKAQLLAQSHPARKQEGLNQATGGQESQ